MRIAIERASRYRAPAQLAPLLRVRTRFLMLKVKGPWRLRTIVLLLQLKNPRLFVFRVKTPKLFIVLKSPLSSQSAFVVPRRRPKWVGWLTWRPINRAFRLMMVIRPRMVVIFLMKILSVVLRTLNLSAHGLPVRVRVGVKKAFRPVSVRRLAVFVLFMTLLS